MDRVRALHVPFVVRLSRLALARRGRHLTKLRIFDRKLRGICWGLAWLVLVVERKDRTMS